MTKKTPVSKLEMPWPNQFPQVAHLDTIIGYLISRPCYERWKFGGLGLNAIAFQTAWHLTFTDLTSIETP